MKKEIDADEQEAFIREVTEEVKNDNLKQMWEKYGNYIILLVVLAIVGAVSKSSKSGDRPKAKPGQTLTLMP